MSLHCMPTTLFLSTESSTSPFCKVPAMAAAPPGAMPVITMSFVSCWRSMARPMPASLGAPLVDTSGFCRRIFTS
eukprot:3586711-Rhodomonas_salina.2